MSRACYTDDWDNESELWLYRQAVQKSIDGKRGQQFLKDLIVALDALPTKRLIDEELELEGGEVCALGSVGKFRNVDMGQLDVLEHDELGKAFNIAPSLAREVMYENDEVGGYSETPEQRWIRMREWALSNIHR